MATIKKDGGYNSLPIAYKRGNPIALDTTAVWYSKAELENYASSGPTAYVGQVVTLVDEASSSCEAYMIANTAGTLVKLAQTTASGDLAGDVATLQTQVNALITTVGNDSSGLVKAVADLNTELGDANSAGDGAPSNATGIYRLIEGALADAEAYTDAQIGDLGKAATVKAYVDAKDAEYDTAASGYATTAKNEAVSEVADALGAGATAANGELTVAWKTEVGTATEATQTTVKAYVDKLDELMDARVDALESTTGRLGALATKDKVAVGDLASDLANKINAKADAATTLAGYGITDAKIENEAKGTKAGYTGKVVSATVTLGDKSDTFITADYLADKSYATEAYVDGKVSGVFHFKGQATSVADDGATIVTAGDKPETITASRENTGYVYQIGDKEYASNGSVWVELGFAADFSGYETETGAQEKADNAEKAAAATLAGALGAGASADEKAVSINWTVGSTPYSTVKGYIDAKATNDLGSLALTANHVTTAYGNVTAMVQSVDTEVHANTAAIELLNKTDGTVGSVKKTVDTAVGSLKLTETSEASADATALVRAGVAAAESYADGKIGSLKLTDSSTAASDATALVREAVTTTESYSDGLVGSYGTLNAAGTAVETAGSGVKGEVSVVKAAAGAAQADVDALEALVGTGYGDGKTVKEYIDNVASKASGLVGSLKLTQHKSGEPASEIKYADATAMVQSVDTEVHANTAAISVLNGSASEAGSVAKAVADAVGTLKLDNAAAHPTAYSTVTAALNGIDVEIHDVKNGLGTLASKSIVTETELAEALAKKINGKADAATTLAGYGITDATLTASQHSESDTTITSATVKLGANSATLITADYLTKNNYATQSYVGEKIGNLGSSASGTAYSTVKEYVDDKVATANSSVNSVSNRVTALETTVNGSGAQGETGYVEGLVSKVSSNTSNIGVLQGYFTAGVANDADKLDGHDSAYFATKTEHDTLAGNVTTVSGKVSTLESTVGDASSGLVKDVSTLKITVGDASSGLVKDVADLQSQITGLSGAMHFVGTATVEITDGGTQDPAISGYDFANDKASGDVVLYGHQEFVWNGSSWEIFGDEGSYALKATTLAGYGITDAYTKTEIDSTIGVKAEDATPATGLYKYIDDKVAAATDEEAIHEISVDGTNLTKANKVVALPLALQAQLGLVKGTNAENGVSINADHTMTVNSVNVNKLVQTAGEYLVIDGGNAALNA